MSYKYSRPTGKLYKVSPLKWNKFYPSRVRWLMGVHKVYLDDDEATVHHTPSMLGLIILVTLSPLVYVYGTFVQGFSDTHKDIKRTLLYKKYGSFSSDMFYKAGSEGWSNLMQMIGKE
jgi:hypothetical protein